MPATCAGAVRTASRRVRPRMRACRLAAWLVLASCSLRSSPCRLRPPTSPTSRRSPSGYAPIVRIVEQRRSAAPASRSSRPTSTSLLATSRPSRCAARGTAPTSSRSAPTRTTSCNRYEYHLDFPGDPLDPGCDYERWSRRLAAGSEPVVYAHVVDRGRVPGQARAPVLVLLPLQRLQQHARGRLGDDPARLRRGRRREALGTTIRSRSATARTRAPSEREWDDDKLEIVDGTQPVVYPGCRLAREQVSATRSSSAAPPRRASAATTREARTASSRRVVETIPSDPAAAKAAYPVDRVRGALGRAPEGVLQRPDRPEPEDAVDDSRSRGRRAGATGATPSRRAAPSARARPTSSAPRVEKGSRALVRLLRNPGLAHPRARRDPRPRRSSPPCGRRGRRSRRFASRAAALVGPDPLRVGADVRQAAARSSSASACCCIPIALVIDASCSGSLLEGARPLGIVTGRGGRRLGRSSPSSSARRSRSSASASSRQRRRARSSRSTRIARSARSARTGSRSGASGRCSARSRSSSWCGSCLTSDRVPHPGRDLASPSAGASSRRSSSSRTDGRSARSAGARALVRRRWIRIGSLVGLSAAIALLAGPLLGALLIFAHRRCRSRSLNLVAGIVYALALPFVAPRHGVRLLRRARAARARARRAPVGASGGDRP